MTLPNCELGFTIGRNTFPGRCSTLSNLRKAPYGMRNVFLLPWRELKIECVEKAFFRYRPKLYHRCLHKSLFTHILSYFMATDTLDLY